MLPADNNKYIAKAKVLKAIAHPTRLWITEKLYNGEQCVCNLVNEVDADFSTISKHLTVLKEAGVVSCEKRGKQVYYTLTTPCLLKFISCIESVIEKQVKANCLLLK